MSVYITDCTIRDGGYLLNKNSEPEFVKGIINGLVKAGIDFVETGFLQDAVNGESIVYKNSADIKKYLPKNHCRTNFLGFCDNSRYSLENLDNYNGESFKWLRISFAKHELESALEFCSGAQKKGYIVQFNPMDTIGYTDDERRELIRLVNDVKPGALSIVDTFGAMYLDDLIHIFKQFDCMLDKDICIGLHSHDNLGLSCALAENMIMLARESGRDVIVDGSLFGMGRGAGNAPTELLANFLNKKCGCNYDIEELLKTIEKYIIPLKSNINWGYNIPMFICGMTHSHIDNTVYLQKNTEYSASDIYKIISGMCPQDRTRYGNGYSKTDYSRLKEACMAYNRENLS